MFWKSPENKNDSTTNGHSAALVTFPCSEEYLPQTISLPSGLGIGSVANKIRFKAQESFSFQVNNFFLAEEGKFFFQIISSE